MEFFFVFLVIAFIIFLFCLYATGRDDIVFIRKNVTIEHLFNIAFLSAVFGLISARLIYALFSLNQEFFNPLVFVLFSYFPGLSLIGGVSGAALFILFFTRRRRIPTGRVFDYVALALLSALPFGYIGTLFLQENLNFFESIYLPIIYIFLFLFFLKFLYPRTLRNDLKSGTLGMFFLLTFSFISLVIGTKIRKGDVFFFLSVEDILAFVLFIASIIILIKQEMISIPGRK